MILQEWSTSCLDLSNSTCSGNVASSHMSSYIMYNNYTMLYWCSKQYYWGWM